MTDLISKIESVLFVAGRPVKLSELAKTLKAEKSDIESSARDLSSRLENSGTTLLQKDGKLQMVSNPANAKSVSAFLMAEQREKLTEAAIETLAIILYKQPISRAEIEAIRGVNSQYILRQLLVRGLIEKATSTEDARRLVYKATLDFMAFLGLKDLKELPDFEELTKSVQLPDVPQANEVTESFSSSEGNTNNETHDQSNENIVTNADEEDENEEGDEGE